MLKLGSQIGKSLFHLLFSVGLFFFIPLSSSLPHFISSFLSFASIFSNFPINCRSWQKGLARPCSCLPLGGFPPILLATSSLPFFCVRQLWATWAQSISGFKPAGPKTHYLILQAGPELAGWVNPDLDWAQIQTPYNCPPSLLFPLRFLRGRRLATLVHPRGASGVIPLSFKRPGVLSSPSPRNSSGISYLY